MEDVTAACFLPNKGNAIVSGSFSFSSMGGTFSEEDKKRFTRIQLNCSYNYFVTPGLALGGELMLERYSANISETTWGVGPQLLYFIGGDQPKMTVKGTTYPFFSAAILYQTTKVDLENAPLTWVYNPSPITMIRFGGGISHMLSNTVGLIVKATYQTDNAKKRTGDAFNISVGVIGFGTSNIISTPAFQ